MKFAGTKDYIATEDLKVAVNAAVTLERPLLVKGEPGTGKTVLAVEIAKALLLESRPSFGEPWLASGSRGSWHLPSSARWLPRRRRARPSAGLDE